MVLGLIKTSFKENERRLPVFPEHLHFVPNDLRRSIVLEKGYALSFKITDSELESMGFKTKTRDDILTDTDIIVLPKPVPNDLKKIPKGKVLWGWTHCVQNYDIAQFAIEKKLTYVSWENMHLWANGNKAMHIFYKNNEIAGYASIIHALELMGMDGYYGERKKVVVFGYGSVSKGAIRALHGRGFNNITVLSKRPFHLIADKDPDVYYSQYQLNNREIRVVGMGYEKSLIDEIRDADVIINGVLQDVSNPVNFLSDTDISYLKPGTLIVDISCDHGMGFEFATPTSFEKPMLEIGDIYYYAVDHTPSYLWRAASREISFALMPYIKGMIAGADEFMKDETIQKAIDIDKGLVLNKDIIAFQKRQEAYPYKLKFDNK